MSKFKNIDKIEEGRGGTDRLGELSASDLERVAGGAGCGWVYVHDGGGWILHTGYPQDE